MRQLLRKISRFGRSTDGPTAVEYAVMVALIAIVCLSSIRLIGRRSMTTFRNTARSLAS